MEDSVLLAQLTSYFDSGAGRQWVTSLPPDDWTKFCRACKKVGGLCHLFRGVKSGQIQFKLPVDPATIPLGTVSEMNSRTTCNGCQSIVNTVCSLSKDLSTADTIQVRVTSDDITVERTSEISKKNSSHPTHDISGRWQKRYDREERGRLFDPYSVDLGLIRRWLLDCATLHGTNCNTIIPKGMTTI